ncbi:MAG: hypothetical protein CVT93_10600 [Bacteroidetes bacterium HGW-Bacteroidetes-10]|nr:MAG: hypothetical protein CVT93_10600 [Bacteroidetes bacterium HGW-Bacteroidetes-10]
MKKILFLTSIIGYLFFAASCEPERVIYNPGDRVEASFPSGIMTVDMIAADNGEFQVEMWRGNTKGAVSVPVTITGNGTKFTPSKSTFDFADGENKAYIKFTYPDINTFGGEAYKITVSISDAESVSYGGKKSMIITAKRKLTFQSLGIGTFTSQFFEDAWPQEVQKAIEADYYRLPDCYYSNYPIEFTIVNGVVSFAQQPMGYVSPTYGMCSWVPLFLSECKVEGKKVTFKVDFQVNDGSFGDYLEILDMP